MGKKADIVIKNAEIYTIDIVNRMEINEAMAVKDGKILLIEIYVK